VVLLKMDITDYILLHQLIFVATNVLRKIQLMNKVFYLSIRWLNVKYLDLQLL
jgi:hypothetical protein